MFVAVPDPTAPPELPPPDPEPAVDLELGDGRLFEMLVFLLVVLSAGVVLDGGATDVLVLDGGGMTSARYEVLGEISSE